MFSVASISDLANVGTQHLEIWPTMKHNDTSTAAAVHEELQKRNPRSHVSAKQRSARIGSGKIPNTLDGRAGSSPTSFSACL